MTGHSILLFLDVSGGELLVIILVTFLVFGPKKMPEIARKIGKAMNEMKRASNDISREFRNQTSDLVNEVNSVQNQVKREVSNTREAIRKNLDVGDPSDQPDAEADPTSAVSHHEAPDTTTPEPLPDVYRQSENAG